MVVLGLAPCSTSSDDHPDGKRVMNDTLGLDAASALEVL